MLPKIKLCVSFAYIAPFCVDEAYLDWFSRFHFVCKFCAECATLSFLVTQETSLGPMCTSSLRKRNKLLMYHWSTHLQSVDLFGSFFQAVTLFTKSVFIWFLAYAERRNLGSSTVREERGSVFGPEAWIWVQFDLQQLNPVRKICNDWGTLF